MREIKFRAWDKVCKEMFYNSELANGDMMVIHLDGRIELSDDDTYKLDDFVIMQYTGLKDKNGKEIYEGDIVEIHDGTITAFRTSGKHIIEWWNGQFVFQANSHEEDDYINFGWWVRSNNHSASLKQIEVIGNIYENPELLK